MILKRPVYNVDDKQPSHDPPGNPGSLAAQEAGSQLIREEAANRSVRYLSNELI